MILNIANAPPGSLALPLYDYTGAAPIFTVDGNNWQMVCNASCSLTFRRLTTAVDVCIVAGGLPGGVASGNIWGDGYYAQGGAGGKGGQVRNLYGIRPQQGTAYPITVGGSGQNSSAFGYSASTGGGSAGGTGALERKTPSARQAGTAGTDGSYAFGGSSGTKYGDGGGGGGAANVNQGGSAAGSGGSSGGGNGGTVSHRNGFNGSANTGGGGGGGYAKFDNTGDYGSGSGGNGGSGVVIIRNHR